MHKLIFQKRFGLFSFAAGVVLGGIIFWASQVSAIFITTPPVTSGTELQVSSISISTSTVSTTIQVNASSTYAGFFLNQSTNLNAGPIIEARANDLPRFIITNAGRVGIATSTPASTLSVQGSALISGEMKAGSIVSTSTAVSIGGVAYTFPSADGVSGQVLTTNGAQTLSWAAGGDWIKLGETIATAATSSLTVSFASSTYLRFYVRIPEPVDGGTTLFSYYFNFIQGQYSDRSVENAVSTAPSATPGCGLDNDATNASRHYTLDWISVGSEYKTGTGIGFVMDGTDNRTSVTHYCSWQNSTSTITSITLVPNSAIRMATSSVIRVYGAAN